MEVKEKDGRKKKGAGKMEVGSSKPLQKCGGRDVRLFKY